MNKRKYNYWGIQVIAWSLLTGSMWAIYNLNGNVLDLEPYQIIMDFFMLLILSIGFSHGLKLSINKSIQFDHIKKRDYLWLIGLIIITSLLFNLTYSLVYIQTVYNFIYDRPDVLIHESQSIKSHLILFINYTVYFFIWVLFYTGIKALLQLNEARLEKLELENNLKSSQLNVLKGQINPHFMFNSLNNIKGLILEDEDRARNMITRLSDMLRFSLVRGNSHEVTLRDELVVVDNYIELSKIQFEDRLTFVKEVDPSLLDFKVPPLLIQILIENAIKHGISTLKKGGTVTLKVNRDESLINIAVINDGYIKTEKQDTGIGIINIKKRLKILYGDEVTFRLVENENRVIAQINIPYEKA